MIQLVIPGMMRTQYLEQTRAKLEEFHPELYANRIESHDTIGLGMAKGVQRGWDLFLNTGADYLLWWEEDMLPLQPAPLNAAVAVLDNNQHLSQMLFQRDPWWGNNFEMESGSVLGGILLHDPGAIHHPSWVEQHHIFSLNPCLVPRRVVELGWPEGPLGVGNESGMTTKLLDLDMTFGVWVPDDNETYAEHIGHERGEGWKL